MNDLGEGERSPGDGGRHTGGDSAPMLSFGSGDKESNIFGDFAALGGLRGVGRVDTGRTEPADDVCCGGCKLGDGGRRAADDRYRLMTSGDCRAGSRGEGGRSGLNECSRSDRRLMAATSAGTSDRCPTDAGDDDVVRRVGDLLLRLPALLTAE